MRGPGGPTLGAARRYLAPLFLAREAKGPLTATGAHYLQFGLPAGPRGIVAPVLHVADGSEVRLRRADGPRLQVWTGRERYGSCLARLTGPRLADGWLPILRTGYRDAAGRRYEQESFAAADRRRRDGDGVRPARRPCRGRPRRPPGRSGSGGGVHGLEWRGGVPRAIPAAAYTGRGRRSTRTGGRASRGDRPRRAGGRRDGRARALLVQNLSLTWRYSVGNAYEEFSFPEGVDDAQVLGE